MSSFSEKLSNKRQTLIQITHTDSLKRLKQFCHQASLDLHFRWDHFSQSILIQCSLFRISDLTNKKFGSVFPLANITKHVDTAELSVAKTVISTAMLEFLGIDEEIYYEDPSSDDNKPREYATTHEPSESVINNIGDILSSIPILRSLGDDPTVSTSLVDTAIDLALTLGDVSEEEKTNVIPKLREICKKTVG